jgi:type IV secretory pathway protease TraF
MKRAGAAHDGHLTRLDNALAADGALVVAMLPDIDMQQLRTVGLMKDCGASGAASEMALH